MRAYRVKNPFREFVFKLNEVFGKVPVYSRFVEGCEKKYKSHIVDLSNDKGRSGCEVTEQGIDSVRADLSRMAGKRPYSKYVFIVLLLVSVVVKWENAVLELFGSIFLSSIVFIIMYMMEFSKRKVVLNYAMDIEKKERFKTFSEHLKALDGIEFLWYVPRSNYGVTLKKSEFVGTIALKHSMQVSYNRSKWIKSDLDFISFYRMGDEFIFMPDMMIRVQKRQVSVINYSEIKLTAGKAYMTSVGGVPKDAKVVDDYFERMSKTYIMEYGHMKLYKGNKEIFQFMTSDIEAQNEFREALLAAGVKVKGSL